MLQFAAAKEHVEQHLVLVLQELPGLVDLGLDVMLAGFGANADFLQLLLVRFVLGAFSRLLITELAEVHDLADRRPFGRRDLDKVQVRLAGHFQRLTRGDHA